jgi:hypothetical protein
MPAASLIAALCAATPHTPPLLLPLPLPAAAAAAAASNNEFVAATAATSTSGMESPTPSITASHQSLLEAAKSACAIHCNINSSSSSSIGKLYDYQLLTSY